MTRKLIKPQDHMAVMAEVAHAMFKTAERNNVPLQIFSGDQDLDDYLDECMETLHQELTGKEYRKLLAITGEILCNNDLAISQYIHDRTYNLLTNAPLYVLEINHFNHELPEEYNDNPLLQQIRLKESGMTLDNISSKLMDELRELDAFENTILYCEIKNYEDDNGAKAMILLPCPNDEQAALVLDHYHQLGKFCANTSVTMQPLKKDEIDTRFIGDLSKILDIIDQANAENQQQIVEDYTID